MWASAAYRDGNHDPSVAAMASRTDAGVGSGGAGGGPDDIASPSGSTRSGSGVGSSVAGGSTSCPGSITGIMDTQTRTVDAVVTVFRSVLRVLCSAFRSRPGWGETTLKSKHERPNTEHSPGNAAAPQSCANISQTSPFSSLTATVRG